MKNVLLKLFLKVRNKTYVLKILLKRGNVIVYIKAFNIYIIWINLILLYLTLSTITDKYNLGCH